MIEAFNVPIAGRRYYDDGWVRSVTDFGYYFTSSPGGSLGYSLSYLFDSGEGVTQQVRERAEGQSLRCFSNDYLTQPGGGMDIYANG